MPTLQDKLTTLSESLSREEVAQIDAVAVDAPPAQYPPEVRAKLQALADQLSPDERNEVLEALADDDVEGFRIKLPLVKEPGQGPEGGGVPGGGPGVSTFDQLQKLANFFIDVTQYPTDKLGNLGKP